MRRALLTIAISCLFLVGCGDETRLDRIVEQFKQAARKNVQAQNSIWDMRYSAKEDIKQLYKEAIAKYLEIAETSRDVADQVYVGMMYSTGEGVPKNDQEAMRWRLKAVEQGSVQALSAIGEHYYFARPPNYEEAMKWNLMAAEKGNAQAQRLVGNMFRDGKGVPYTNITEAGKWFLRAAEQGDEFAQRSIGEMYLMGTGVPKDFALAYMWINLATTKLPHTTQDFREALERTLTPTQSEEGQRLTREWLEKHPKK